MWKIPKYPSISLPRDEPNGASSVVLALVSALVDAARRTLDEHGRQVDHGRPLLPLPNLLVHQTLGTVPVPGGTFLGSFMFYSRLLNIEKRLCHQPKKVKQKMCKNRLTLTIFGRFLEGNLTLTTLTIFGRHSISL